MGFFYFLLIVSLWFTHLFYCLSYAQAVSVSALTVFHVLVQAYLFTGLFITAHDAMHGTVNRNKFINDSAGRISAVLYAAFSYKKLIKNHRLHHSSPGTSSDPDFYAGSGNFFVWWFVFLMRYVSLTQLAVMAAVFNILSVWFDQNAIIFYWIIPAFISTLQLFYFGTYYPHKRPHSEEMMPHNARTRKKNHLLAMLSCYFFGYHFEHHTSPGTPWWRLYKLK